MRLIEKPVVMTIDDDPVILSTLASILKAEYSIRPFLSGRLALDYLTHQAAELILLDYQMPDATGLDILKELQGDPRTQAIPTIFLTSSSDKDSEVKALELGAVDYITKPIRPKLLLTRVKLQLELLKHRRQLETLVEERTRNLNEAYHKLKAREEVMLGMLAKATDLRDRDTGGHLERTTEFVRVIVNDILSNPRPGYVISDKEAEDISRSSKLHDLGKIAMPDHILLKSGRLSKEEFDIVKRHPSDGEKFLNEFVQKMDDSFLETARAIAYSHHERWDGTGYPLGLKGDSIPLSARIVAIADVYDALTSVRSYKTPISHEEAVNSILESSGTHFDPYLTCVFWRHADEFQRICEQIDVSDVERLGARCC